MADPLRRQTMAERRQPGSVVWQRGLGWETMPLSAEVSSPCGAQMAAGCWPVMTFAGRSTEHALDTRKQTSTVAHRNFSPAQGGRLEAQVSSTWLTFAAGLALLPLLQ